MAHKLDGLYKGLPIFVISTGTSLRGFDFRRLDGRITVGINRVIEHYRPAVMHFVDISAHVTHAGALRGYNGMIIAGPGAGPTRTHDNTFVVGRDLDTFRPRGGRAELSQKVGRSFADGLFGDGAGCTALHAAILLGGDPIYLLGYDYYEENGRHFDAYDESRNDPVIYATSSVGIEHISREEWIPRIYNCNSRSILKCFPHADPDELLPPRGEEIP